ncbi:RluA family pseudouridine synthase [Candidatus Poribacteria bacterium]|nr:RluA family pseudouridine synthase [Candidatus Poribacteria bacterium]
MAEIFVVDNKEDENLRLDVFVQKKKPDISRTWIQKLIQSGHITVNRENGKSGYKVKYNDQIEAVFPEAIPDEKAEPENIPLEIIYEDKNLIVINKPSGMVVHPAPGNLNGTLVNALLYHCKNLSGINGVLRPGIVHRLDKNTSGLMVIAKDDITHQKLKEEWEERKVNRKYIALIHGSFSQDKFMINAPIGRDPDDRQKMKVTDKNSRIAITHFEVIKKINKYTLLFAKLDTGRTHQVRVHLAFIKHPVVGDSMYGKKKDSDIISRQALHSALLGFKHPIKKKYMEFESPLPEDIQNAINNVGCC